MKKIGLLAMALVLALGAMGAGIAYFSDTALIENTSITAGDTDIQISKDGNTWHDTSALTSLFSVSDWCPGAEYTACLWIKNVGTCDARTIFLDWEYNEGNMPDFCKVIEVTKWEDWWHGGGHWVMEGDDLAVFDNDFWGEDDGKCSLAEWMIGKPWSSLNPWDTMLYVCDTEGDCDPEGVILPAGGDPYTCCMTLKFMPEAGNDYQNASISFYIVVAATGLPCDELADLAAKTDLL